MSPNFRISQIFSYYIEFFLSKNINCKIVDGVFRAGILGANSEVSETTFKVKSDEDARFSRFITDSRLKDDNDKYNVPKFGNMNNR